MWCWLLPIAACVPWDCSPQQGRCSLICGSHGLPTLPQPLQRWRTDGREQSVCVSVGVCLSLWQIQLVYSFPLPNYPFLWASNCQVELTFHVWLLIIYVVCLQKEETTEDFILFSSFSVLVRVLHMSQHEIFLSWSKKQQQTTIF